LGEGFIPLWPILLATYLALCKEHRGRGKKKKKKKKETGPTAQFLSFFFLVWQAK